MKLNDDKKVKDTSSTAVAGGFLKNAKGLNLYPEEPEIKALTPEEEVKSEYKRMLKDLVNEVTAIQGMPGNII